MEEKFFFSEMYGTCIVNAYILFGKALHTYTGTGYIYRSIEERKKRKSTDPMRGKFDFSQ